MFEIRRGSYESRREFERNAMLLSERMDLGQFNISARSSHLIKGIQKARYLPNGRINLLTIDESVRATMHMMGHMSSNKDNLYTNEEEE